MTKTHSVKAADVKKEWVLIDASNQTVGRLCSEIARVMRGKHKPTFTPNLDCGDNVVVINAEKVKFSGNKSLQKLYQHHTGYIGGIKAITAQDMLAKHPERVIEKAVFGMLPKSILGKNLHTNLKVYAGAEHPHAGQNPKVYTPATARTAGRKN